MTQKWEIKKAIEHTNEYQQLITEGWEPFYVTHVGGLAEVWFRRAEFVINHKESLFVDLVRGDLRGRCYCTEIGGINPSTCEYCGGVGALTVVRWVEINKARK